MIRIGLWGVCYTIIMVLVKIEALKNRPIGIPKAPERENSSLRRDFRVLDVSFFEKHEDMVQLKCMVVKCSVMSCRVGKSKNRVCCNLL